MKRIDVGVYSEMFAQNKTFDFVLVDDCSTDDTLQILDTFSSAENVSVLKLNKNLGKAEAIRFAVNSSNLNSYNYIGYLDADLSTPINEMEKLNDFIQSNTTLKFVMGARIKLIGNKVERSLTRHYFGRVFATIASQFILKTPVYDTQCGAKIIDKDLAIKLFEAPFQTKWLFDLELLLRFKKLDNRFNTKVAEIPLFTWKEMPGSKIKLVDFIRIPFQLLKLFLKNA